MDIAASKMSQEEGQNLKEDFRKLDLGTKMKVVAGAGTSIVVGQAIGLIPHPVAKGVKFAWQATGAVAASNKMTEISEKLQEFGEKHPKAFQVMEEHRDQQLAKLKAERRERFKRSEERMKEDLLFG